jgi:dephospho-CoA kinase
VSIKTVIAVSGDVGAGKSRLSKLLEGMGGFLIDADQVVAELWRVPEITAAAVGRWGAGILDGDGRVLREAVAERVFTDQGEHKWLMGLLHPRVWAEVKRRLDLFFSERGVGGWAVVEAPLLFESGAPPWITATVFVTARRETRLARCRARGWDEAELTRREGFFLPSEERMARSDHVVHNDGTLEELKEIVKGLCGALKGGLHAGLVDHH